MIEGVSFKFEGRDADEHRLEARYFGATLIGLDRAVDDGLLLLVNGRLPKRGERFGFYLAAEQPVEGSFELPTELRDVAWALPLVQEFVASRGKEYVQALLEFLLSWHGGRKADGVEQMDALIEMLREVNRNHETEGDHWRDMVLQLVDKLKPSAEKIVDPIGRSADSLHISGGRHAPVLVDEAMAEAIRSKEEIEVLDMETMTFRIDGITRHTRQMKVEFPEVPGKYVSAEVRDPTFELEQNQYTDAFAANRMVTVRARRALRSGELFRLYIMEFLSVEDASVS